MVWSYMNKAVWHDCVFFLLYYFYWCAFAMQPNSDFGGNFNELFPIFSKKLSWFCRFLPWFSCILIYYETTTDFCHDNVLLREFYAESVVNLGYLELWRRYGPAAMILPFSESVYNAWQSLRIRSFRDNVTLSATFAADFCRDFPAISEYSSQTF